MTRRRYDQACSLAGALDRIGERWSLLIVRELLLGPVRFSELARDVGGAPTDVLTKRLRELEEAGVVRRRELPPPASATAYELTEVGRELERPLIELGRWGLNFHDAASVEELSPTSLPNALRVILRPPRDAELTLRLLTGGREYRLRLEDGWIDARRGEAVDADLTLRGSPFDVLATLVADDSEPRAEVEGDLGALERLRAMVSIPEELRQGALAHVAAAT